MKKQILFLCSLLFLSVPFCFAESVAEQEKEEVVEVPVKTEFDELSEILLSGKEQAEICDLLSSEKFSKKTFNQKFEDGYTPLLVAIKLNQPQVFEALLKKGANKNQVSSFTLRDKSGRRFLRCNPFLYAAWEGNIDCLKILLANEAKTDVEADLIIPGDYPTYIRLILPIDAAFYNRKKINFNDVHKTIKDTVQYTHTHFSGKSWAYTKLETKALLQEYNVLEIK